MLKLKIITGLNAEESLAFFLKKKEKEKENAAWPISKLRCLFIYLVIV